MRSHTLLALPLLCLALAASAQEAPADSNVVIKKNTHVVILDVVVVDNKQNPVGGLKRSDFTVLEKGQQQTISSFEEHAPAPPTSLAMPKLPPNTFTNYTPTQPNSAVNILLLDALNTPMKDQAYVRYQMLQYLKNMPPNTRIAVFGLTTRLRLLQGFTSDPAILRALIDKKTPNSSVLLDNPVGGEASESMTETFSNSPGMAAMAANIQQFEAEQASFQTQMRAQYTLDALNSLALYLTGIPGRKNLIWFSGSFPIDIMPDGDLADPFIAMADFGDQLRKTSDLLTQSQVAVYPVDARGLVTPPMFSASQSGRQFAGNPAAMNKALGQFSQAQAAEHMTMDQMADDTGGKAFYNTNGLKEAVAKAIDFGSHYYTISYTPDRTDWKGDFRKIKVQLANGGDYKLYYRHGYYADDPEAVTRKSQPSHNLAVPARTAMDNAMLRGAPSPTQIIFEAHIAAAPGLEPTAAAGNGPAAKVKGPYRRYVVDLAIDPRNIAFQATPDGLYHGVIDFEGLVYDVDGNILNGTSTTMHADLKTATYTNALQHGIPMHMQISVPQNEQKPNSKPVKQPAYFLRIGVHDVKGDRVGAIEVDTASVKEEPAAKP